MNDPTTLLVTDDATPTDGVAFVKVWDRFVRLLHWSLVILFAFAWLSGNRWDTPHEWAGYAIAALVLARMLWGFTGSQHARFVDFVKGPRAVFRFLVDTARLRATRYLGHNPAGGAMVIALLGGIIIICLSGYMMTTDRFWGVDWVHTVHTYSVNIMLGMLALHLLGVLLASVEHRENLVKSMVSGIKRQL